MSKWQKTIESFNHLTDKQLKFIIDFKTKQASEIQSEAAILRRVLKQRSKNGN